MENKFFVVSNTQLLKQHIRVKNIRFAYIGVDPFREKPTTNLNYDTDCSELFRRYIKVYMVTIDDDCLKMKEVGGKEEYEFKSILHLIYSVEKMEYHYFFLDKPFYNSHEELSKAIRDWAKIQVNDLAKQYIVDYLEDYED